MIKNISLLLILLSAFFIGFDSPKIEVSEATKQKMFKTPVDIQMRLVKARVKYNLGE